MTYNRSETLVREARTLECLAPDGLQTGHELCITERHYGLGKRDSASPASEGKVCVYAVGTTKPTALILLKAQYVYIFQEVAMRS